MNKTININIGGTFFHIDEEAYDELQHYLVILKKSFHETQGSDEIISDIEHRIAELFSERLTDMRQVINRKDVDQIIEIMGRPEEFSDIEEDDTEFRNQERYSSAQAESTSEQTTSSSSSSSKKKSKKRHYDKELFRDTEEGLIGGVLAGFGHYIGVDKTWVRIIWLLLTFTTVGTFLLIYLILWAIVPQPRSTADRLKMKGERINVTNIEKAIREEMSNLGKEVGELSDKVRNTDFKQMGDNVKNSAQRLTDKGKPLVRKFFRLIAKIIGSVILVFTSMFAISLLLAWLGFGIFGLFDTTVLQDFVMLNETDLPIWLATTIAFIVTVVPVILFMILGLKLVFIKSERSYRSLGLSLLGVWILAALTAAFFGIKQSVGYQSTGSKTTTDVLDLSSDSTIHIMMNPVFEFEDEVEDRSDFKYLTIADGERMILNDEIDLRIQESRTNEISVKVKRRASGYDNYSAKERASNINYEYQVEDETLIFNDYYIHNVEDKVKGQEVLITIFIPENQTFTLDRNIKRYFYTRLDNDMDYSSRYMVDHKWQLINNELICLDCRPTETQDQNAPKSEDDLGNQSTDSLSEDYNF